MQNYAEAVKDFVENHATGLTVAFAAGNSIVLLCKMRFFTFITVVCVFRCHLMK